VIEIHCVNTGDAQVECKLEVIRQHKILAFGRLQDTDVRHTETRKLGNLSDFRCGRVFLL